MTASKDGSVRVWDGINSQCVRSIVGAHISAEATSATFTKDQRYMHCILANGRVYFIQAESMIDLTLPTLLVTTEQFSIFMLKLISYHKCDIIRYVLSCGKDSTVKLWEVGTGRLVRQYLGATHTQFRSQVCLIEHFSKIILG